MYNEKIVSMIMDARKQGNSELVLIYQNLKNEFLKFTTAKNAKPLDDAAEFQIIRKIVKECADAAEGFKAAGRMDLYNEDMKTVEVLTELLPKGPSDAELKEAIENFISTLDSDFDRKQMGACIKEVKAKFPTADGKTVSTLVQSYL